MKYGYPGRTLVGDEYSNAFLIISSSTIEYGKKHYDLIIAAAKTGELDWEDIAFFIQRVKYSLR